MRKNFFKVLVLLALIFLPLHSLSSGLHSVLVLSKEVDSICNDSNGNIIPPIGTVIFNSKATSHKYIGSPSIAILNDGTYIVSHDYFGNFLSDTFLYMSKDHGYTWTRISEIKQLNWSKLFVHGSELYLLGVRPKGSSGYGDCVILRSLDNGYTWTSPHDQKSGLLLAGFYHTAPTPVAFYHGRIWKAMENRGKIDGWGDFSSFVMSVKEKNDLLDASNWTISNEMKFDTASLKNATTWLEGNIVIKRGKEVKNILRVHYPLDDKAAVMDVSRDGKNVAFNSSTGIIDFPGGSKKFNILYDEKSKKYWTLSNYVLDKDKSGYNERTRNTVALSWSDDLIHWHIKDIVLHHLDVGHHGFQYLDWLIDGDDIIAVSRTAWEDETGNADNQHNANYLTFHRFTNFREEK